MMHPPLRCPSICGRGCRKPRHENGKTRGGTAFSNPNVEYDMRLPRISLPRAIVVLLCLLAGLYLVEAIGRATGLFSVYSGLWLSPAAVGDGQLWRLFTHALLAGGLLDLVLGAVMLVWLGTRVARVWSPLEFFLYCGICAAGAGAVLCLISSRNDGAALGTAVLVLALLVPWARMFGHERLRLTATWEVRIFTLALVVGLAMVLLNATLAGWRHGLFLLSAAGSGWLYLSLRWKANRAQPAQAVESGRINRLEL